MAARQSSATDKALELVSQGFTPYRAAKTVGIALTTIYRALKRQKRPLEALDSAEAGPAQIVDAD